MVPSSHSPGALPGELKASDFDKIRRLAYQEFGLDLKQGKEELVSARLGKILRRGAFPSFASYYEHVVADRTGEALIEMIDALTTNHTSFLREPAHFEFLEEAARADFKATQTLRIWSAACSTGEEPYSIAFYLLNAGLAPSGFRVVATDISTRALAKARRAIYPAERFDQVPQPWRRRFLLQGDGDWKGWYKVKPEVTETVEFRRLNLMTPFAGNDTYHIIFCRNVMMYFDRKTQADLVNRMAARLEPGGYFFVGHSESLTGVDHPLTYCRPATYRNGRLRHGGTA
jgi:chemotaxis protein methyltransferase CheR